MKRLKHKEFKTHAQGCGVGRQQTRNGIQGYLASVPVMLTTHRPPSVLFCEHPLCGQLQLGPGDMEWKPQPCCVGESGCCRCGGGGGAPWENFCSCLLVVGKGYEHGTQGTLLGFDTGLFLFSW